MLAFHWTWTVRLSVEIVSNTSINLLGRCNRRDGNLAFPKNSQERLNRPFMEVLEFLFHEI
jgi:hypothetical protein